MSGQRVYPPAVWWLPKRVRDALAYEEGMRGIASQPVTDDTGEPVPGQPEASPAVRAVRPLPPVASVLPGQIFPPDNDQSSSRQRFLSEDRTVVDEYYRSAVSGDGAGYWCRVDGCMHRAPAHGDVCPVHKDQGFKAILDGGDAA